MPLFIYNNLTRKKEEFVPLSGKKVSMYVCGITPYDETHLGHGRAYVTFDIVRRYLEAIGYQVEYVQNVTDIDDKIIKKSKIQNPKSKENPNQENPKQACVEVASKYFASYQEAMKQLNVLPPTKYVKATEHIADMVKWISSLIDKGFAYTVDGDVYFEVSKFESYGKLSRRKLDEMKSGARVEVDGRKRAPLDFALWKTAKEGEPSWNSPWGAGRPGWHIECSVMSTKYLGEQFDIHGGGLDLVFPHHENEIAQTEALTGKPWVKYWLHNGFVNINNEKMSKSLGNFFTLKDIFSKYPPMAVRFFLLSTHYRSPINFTDGQLKDAQKGLARIWDTADRLDFALKNLKAAPGKNNLNGELMELVEKYNEAMNDDFNSALAVGVIFEIVAFANRILDERVDDRAILEKTIKALVNLTALLGLEKVERSKEKGVQGEEIEKLIAERNAARKQKNFQRADEIRKNLLEKGIIIEDTPDGARWKNA